MRLPPAPRSGWAKTPSAKGSGCPPHPRSRAEKTPFLVTLAMILTIVTSVERLYVTFTARLRYSLFTVEKPSPCSGPHRCPRWCCHARWASDRLHERTRWSFGAELDVLHLPLQIHSLPSCCGGISGLPAPSRPSSPWSGLWTCSPRLLPSLLCVGLGDQALLVPPTRATL